MIVYNVTLKAEHDIHEEWLDWMKTVHIPDVMATGCFLSYKICRLLKQDEDGVTYAIQYYCESTKVLHQYQVKHAAKLQKEHIDKFGERVLAFRTLMEVLDEG